MAVCDFSAVFVTQFKNVTIQNHLSWLQIIYLAVKALYAQEY